MTEEGQIGGPASVVAVNGVGRAVAVRAARRVAAASCLHEQRPAVAPQATHPAAGDHEQLEHRHPHRFISRWQIEPCHRNDHGGGQASCRSRQSLRPDPLGRRGRRRQPGSAEGRVRGRRRSLARRVAAGDRQGDQARSRDGAQVRARRGLPRARLARRCRASSTRLCRTSTRGSPGAARTRPSSTLNECRERGFAGTPKQIRRWLQDPAGRVPQAHALPLARRRPAGCGSASTPRPLPAPKRLARIIGSGDAFTQRRPQRSPASSRTPRQRRSSASSVVSSASRFACRHYRRAAAGRYRGPDRRLARRRSALRHRRRRDLRQPDRAAVAPLIAPRSRHVRGRRSGRGARSPSSSC